MAHAARLHFWCRAAALACPACLLACPALACALAAGLASAALLFGMACAGSLIVLPLRRPSMAAASALLAGLPTLRPFVPSAGLSCCLPCCCMAGGISCPAGGLFGPWLAGLLTYGGGLASALAGLPYWRIKIRPCLACWLASALPFRRLAPWLALAGFVLLIKIGGGLLACFGLAC